MTKSPDCQQHSYHPTKATWPKVINSPSCDMCKEEKGDDMTHDFIECSWEQKCMSQFIISWSRGQITIWLNHHMSWDPVNCTHNLLFNKRIHIISKRIGLLFSASISAYIWVNYRKQMSIKYTRIARRPISMIKQWCCWCSIVHQVNSTIHPILLRRLTL